MSTYYTQDTVGENVTPKTYPLDYQDIQAVGDHISSDFFADDSTTHKITHFIETLPPASASTPLTTPNKIILPKTLLTAIKTRDLESIKNALADIDIANYKVLLQDILKNPLYHLAIKQLILEKILKECEKTTIESRCTKYHEYLEEIPLELLTVFASVNSDLELYLHFRKQTEETKKARGYELLSSQQTGKILTAYETSHYDQSYEDFPMPKTVLLYVFAFFGFGDLSACAKIAQLLKKANPRTQVIIINMPSCGTPNAKEFLVSYPCDCPVFQEVSEVTFDHQDAVAIGVATIKAVSLQKLGCPYFSVDEYDTDSFSLEYPDAPSIPKGQYRLGFGAETIGILIDEDMRMPVTELQKSFLQTYALEDKGFYFGYSGSAGATERFLKTVIRCHQNTTDSITCVLKCYRNTARPECLRAMLQTLDDNIEITVRFYDTTGVHEEKIKEGEKKLTIVALMSTISHEKMKTLIKCSKDLCLVTGDQSLSEAISADKLFFYEKLMHKITLWKTLCHLGRQVNGPDFEHFLQNLGIPENPGNTPFSYDDFATNLPHIRAQFSKLNEFIATNINANRRIILKLKRTLAQSKNQ